jgi:predicted N-acyltransferase
VTTLQLPNLASGYQNYSTILYDDIAGVPMGDWPTVWGDGWGSGHDLAMDRRLVEIFQNTMRGQCRCWYIAVRNAMDETVGGACICRFVVDGLGTTGPMVQRFARGLRTVAPDFIKFGVLFCGLPVPSASSHVRIRENEDRAAVIGAIERRMRLLAHETKSRLIVWREFDDESERQVHALRQRQYIRGNVPSAHSISGNFESFAAFAGALRARYRQQVTRSQKKFKKAGCTAHTLTGQAAADAFTDELHALYITVRDKAEYRMETLSADFFRSTIRRFGKDASLTLAMRNGKTLGFLFGLKCDQTYHNLYVGLDYAANHDADIYFNLYYHDMDHAFKNGCRRVELGQTSDAFKTRLGSMPRNVYFFARAANPVLHRGLMAVSRWVFPPVSRPEMHQVFKSALGEEKESVHSL